MALLALAGESLPLNAEQGPALLLEPCLDVDQTTVRDLIDLELQDIQRKTASPAISVAVICREDAQEIRVEPWATSLGAEGVRGLQLPLATEGDPAGHEARSRELALVIAELIRRLVTLHPVEPPPPSPPPPPAAVPLPPEPERPGVWQMGLAAGVERFAGGMLLAGGELVAGRAWGRWMFTEVRAGARWGGDQPLPQGRWTPRAATVSVALGPAIWWRERTSALALALRAQSYLLDVHLTDDGSGDTRSARFGALITTAGPWLLLGWGRHFAFTANAGVGVPVHGVVVRVQGTETRSLTGLVLAGSLGASLRF